MRVASEELVGVYHSERSVSRKGGPGSVPGTGAMRALTQALKDLIDAIHVHILAGHELVAAHRRPVRCHGACRMTAVGRGRPLRRRPNGMGGRRR